MDAWRYGTYLLESKFGMYARPCTFSIQFKPLNPKLSFYMLRA